MNYPDPVTVSEQKPNSQPPDHSGNKKYQRERAVLTHRTRRSQGSETQPVLAMLASFSSGEGTPVLLDGCVAIHRQKGQVYYTTAIKIQPPVCEALVFPLYHQHKNDTSDTPSLGNMTIT